MPSYTITKVNDGFRTWSTKQGAEMKSYRVTLRNKDGRELGDVEVSRVSSAPLPTVGESIEGDVDRSGQYGPKFKAARPGGPGGGFRGKTAEERRSIAMQASQKVAVDVAALVLQHNKPLEEVDQLVLDVAERLFAQVMKAEASA